MVNELSLVRAQCALATPACALSAFRRASHLPRHLRGLGRTEIELASRQVPHLAACPDGAHQPARRMRVGAQEQMTDLVSDRMPHHCRQVGAGLHQHRVSRALADAVEEDGRVEAISCIGRQRYANCLRIVFGTGCRLQPEDAIALTGNSVGESGSMSTHKTVMPAFARIRPASRSARVRVSTATWAKSITATVIRNSDRAGAFLLCRESVWSQSITANRQHRQLGCRVRAHVGRQVPSHGFPPWKAFVQGLKEALNALRKAGLWPKGEKTRQYSVRRV